MATSRRPLSNACFICVAPNQNLYILPLQPKSYFPNIPIFTPIFFQCFL